MIYGLYQLYLQFAPGMGWSVFTFSSTFHHFIMAMVVMFMAIPLMGFYDKIKSGMETWDSDDISKAFKALLNFFKAACIGISVVYLMRVLLFVFYRI